MSQTVYGKIMNYRIGTGSQMSKWCLIQFPDVDSVSKASRLIGRKLIWKHGESSHIGQIMDLHGKKGVVKVKFRKGVPGQALGTTVELIG